jgi:hypothetical protein
LVGKRSTSIFLIHNNTRLSILGIQGSVDVVDGKSGSTKVVLTHGCGSSAEVTPDDHVFNLLVTCQSISNPERADLSAWCLCD